MATERESIEQAVAEVDRANRLLETELAWRAERASEEQQRPGRELRRELAALAAENDVLRRSILALQRREQLRGDAGVLWFGAIGLAVGSTLWAWKLLGSWSLWGLALAPAAALLGSLSRRFR